MSFYPVNLQLTTKLCLVIGGGPVALRKVKSLLQGGGVVRVISPEAGAELREMSAAGEIEWIERGYVEGDLRGAFLVFAATDNPQIQSRIIKEAMKTGVLCNSADDPQSSHFHVPAHFRRGNMLVTVSTGGSSPGLAKRLRQQLEAQFVPEYEAVVELLAMIRGEVVSLDDDSWAHGALFNRLLDQGLVNLVLNSRWFDLQMLLLQELPPGIDAVALFKTFLEKYDTSGK